MNYVKVLRLFLALFAFAALAVPALAAESAVTVSSNKFTSSRVTVAPGDTVKWTNSGGFHDVTFDEGDFGQPDPPSSSLWTVSRTFGTAGTFRYYCSVHGGPGGIGMAGSVVVSDGATAPTPITEPPDDQGIVAFAVTLKTKKLSTNRKGTLFSLSGTASPAAPGAKAQIQLRGKGGVFKTVATTLLKGSESARSDYAKKLRLGKTGVYRVRVPKAGDVRTGLSPNRRATVK